MEFPKQSWTNLIWGWGGGALKRKQPENLIWNFQLGNPQKTAFWKLVLGFLATIVTLTFFQKKIELKLFILKRFKEKCLASRDKNQCRRRWQSTTMPSDLSETCCCQFATNFGPDNVEEEVMKNAKRTLGIHLKQACTVFEATCWRD